MSRDGSHDDRAYRKRGRGPSEATPESLERAALAYLDRFDSTASNLRNVLLRRVRKSAQAHGTDAREGARAVEDIVARFRESRLLDDARYAEHMAASLRGRGSSARAIRHKLSRRGVDSETIDRALASVDAGVPESEVEAARAFARRRRLGAYGAAEGREDRRARDLGALARAGFSWDVAREVLDD